jgi:hypothetical protein
VSRRYNLRLLSPDATYYATELATKLKINIGTVRRWGMQGLAPIERKPPYLFLGADVIAFLKARAVPPTKLADGQFYCTPCRAARLPAGGVVRLQPRTATCVTFVGTCPVCSHGINRHVCIAEIAEKLGQVRIAGENEPATIKRSQDSPETSPLQEFA